MNGLDIPLDKRTTAEQKKVSYSKHEIVKPTAVSRLMKKTWIQIRSGQMT